MMLAGPPFEVCSGGPDSPVTHVDVLGGDLCFEVKELFPNSGWSLATYRRLDDRPTRIQFDLTWIDHHGLQRKAFGVGDLLGPGGPIEMRPLEI